MDDNGWTDAMESELTDSDPDEDPDSAACKRHLERRGCNVRIHSKYRVCGSSAVVAYPDRSSADSSLRAKTAQALRSISLTICTTSTAYFHRISDPPIQEPRIVNRPACATTTIQIPMQPAYKGCQCQESKANIVAQIFSLPWTTKPGVKAGKTRTRDRKRKAQEAEIGR